MYKDFCFVSGMEDYSFFFFFPHGYLNSVAINSFCAAKLPIETLFSIKVLALNSFQGEKNVYT